MAQKIGFTRIFFPNGHKELATELARYLFTRGTPGEEQAQIKLSAQIDIPVQDAAWQAMRAAFHDAGQFSMDVVIVDADTTPLAKPYTDLKTGERVG